MGLNKQYWLDRGSVDEIEYKYKDICIEELIKLYRKIYGDDSYLYYDTLLMCYVPTIIISILSVTNYKTFNLNPMLDSFICFYTNKGSKFICKDNCSRYSNGNFKVDDFSFAFSRLYALKLKKEPMPILEFMG